MDPTTLMQLLQMHQMMGQQGQLPGMGQTPGAMPQLPSYADPSQQPPQQQQHRGGGLSPLMALSPMGGLFASNPKLGLAMMSPAFGIANLLGAFK